MVSLVYVLVLASFIGLGVITRVSRLLHTRSPAASTRR
jgi:hypothetical protein